MVRGIKVTIIYLARPNKDNLNKVDDNDMIPPKKSLAKKL